jgi:hypothetical protein
MGWSSRRRSLVVAILAAGLLSMTAPAVLAEDDPLDYITDLTVVSTTIDVHSHAATLTFDVTCLVDVGFLRTRVRIAQGDEQASLNAESSCSAGETKRWTLLFESQASGRFHPGRAELEGFVVALCCARGDADTFPIDHIIILPA